MRRVDDDHRSIRHILKHLVQRDFLCFLPSLGFQLRIAFGLLHLVQNLLPGHTVLGHMGMALPGIIDGGDGTRHDHDNNDEFGQEVGHHGGNRPRVARRRRDETVRVAQQEPDHQTAEQDHLHGGFEELEQSAGTEFVLGIRQDGNARELGRKLGRRNDDGALRDQNDDDKRDRGGNDQADRDQPLQHDVGGATRTTGRQRGGQRLGILQQAATQIRQSLTNVGRNHDQREKRAQISGPTCQVLRFDELAFAARLVQLLRRGLVTAFCAVVLAHGIPPPMGSARTATIVVFQTVRIKGAARNNRTALAPVIAGAPTRATINWGIARFITPIAAL